MVLKWHLALTLKAIEYLCKGTKFGFLEDDPFDDGKNVTMAVSPLAVVMSAREDETPSTQLLLHNMTVLT